MERYIELFKYAYTRPKKFEGRACRAEFASFAIPYTLIVMVVMMVAFFFLGLGAGLENFAISAIGAILFIALFIFGLASIPAAFGVSCRRLHDLNMSGWLLALNFVPLINYIASIVFFVLLYFIPGTEGDNQYGPISEKY